MTIPFAKGHGLGNDYIVLDAAQDLPFDLSEASIVRICDRNWGIGSDGILDAGPVHAGPSSACASSIPTAARPRSRATGCGSSPSGCATTATPSRTASRSTPRAVSSSVSAHGKGGRVAFVTVEMGRATFRAPDIPMNGPDRDVVGVPLQLSDGSTVSATAVSVGNPHCVVFVEHLDTDACKRIGTSHRTAPAFPQRTNVQFARAADKHTLDILIWERGAGYTLASGSSSCAAASAAVRNGRCDHGRVTVRMPGGDLVIDVRPDWSLKLEGPVEEVYTGALSARVRGGLAHARHAVKRVCVFCGSSPGARADYADAARALAAELARRRLGLVYGGGSVGIMGVARRRRAGRRRRGHRRHPAARWPAASSRTRASPSCVSSTACTSARPRWPSSPTPSSRCPAASAPSRRCSRCSRGPSSASTTSPSALLNVAGYWDALVQLLDHAARERFVRPEYLGLPPHR